MKEIVTRALDIRAQYHALERQHHGSIWTIEEDALAFLTDAALVGRLAMSQQGRWPTTDTQERLKHKLGECIWWIIVLSERMGIDPEEATAHFLSKTEQALGQ